jgi:hypothetical protein
MLGEIQENPHLTSDHDPHHRMNDQKYPVAILRLWRKCARTVAYLQLCV